MGWLFGKKDDGLYRGDAPASAPGLDGVEPSAYQDQASARPYDPGLTVTPTPYTTGSAPYQAGSAPYQADLPQPSSVGGLRQPVPPVVGVGQPYVPGNPVPPAGPQFSFGAGTPPVTGVPPELAAAIRYAQAQQQVITKTLARTLMGFFLPLILIAGLVVVGFVVVDNVSDGIDNPFSFGSAPNEPFQGVVGTAGDVTFGENSYRVTIDRVTAQPSAAWGSYFSAVSGGFLVIELSLTRTDTNGSASQISWYDWQFTPESGPAVDGALIAGGYEPLLSTLNLAPDEAATGLVAFDTADSVGTLSLTNFDGTWAEWPISATVAAAVVGAFGVPLQPEVGLTPFTVTVANPRWIGAGDPAAIFDPDSGTYFVVDVSVTIDEAALASLTSLTVGYNNFQFTPDGGVAAEADFGVTGTASLTFGTGLPTTAGAVFAFDAVRGPGTLTLVNSDGSILASWVVPAL